MRTPSLTLLALVAILASAPRLVAGADSELCAPAGAPLGPALLDLAERDGLRVLFSDRLVLDSLRVEEAVSAATPEGCLAALLRPHGLTARRDFGDLFVVVAAPTARLRGRVVLRGTEEGVADVLVRLPEVGRETRTDSEGRFELDRLDPGLYTIEGRQPGLVATDFPDVRVAAGPAAEVLLVVDPAPVTLEEIVVTTRADTLDLGPAGPRPQTVQPVQLREEPALGSDVFRSVSRLTGVTGNDASSRVQVRGGRDDELLVLLDGVELHSPFHLQDFDSAASLVTPESIGAVSLVSGGFGAEHGDRMGGLLDLRSVTPSGGFTTTGSLSLIDGAIAASGRLPAKRGHWFTSARKGWYHEVIEDQGHDQQPDFWDGFAKIALDPGARHSFRLSGLLGADDFRLPARFESGDSGFAVGVDSLDESPIDPGAISEDYRNHWSHRYLWLSHESVLAPRLVVESVLSSSQLGRDRGGSGDTEGAVFDLVDRRDAEILGLDQSWTLAGRRWLSTKWGYQIRRLSSSVRYANQRDLESPLSVFRTLPAEGETIYDDDIRGWQTHLFGSQVLVPVERLSLEVGARLERNDTADELRWSPRLNLALEASSHDTLRFAWGWFHQSQRPYELQVEDGETELRRAERSEHRSLGYEHTWVRGASLRAEVYQRLLRHPRPRYENLFNPVVVFAELAQDRVRILPERGEARGIEITYRSRRSRSVSGWAGYTLSRSEDRVDGRWVPRSIDARHALRLGLDASLPAKVRLAAVWDLHSGWPTTSVGATAGVDGAAPTPFLGPLHGERLPAFRRLDLRLTREWSHRRQRIGVHLDVRNVLDRRNLRGFDGFRFDVAADGGVTVEAHELDWSSRRIIAGLRWSY